MTRVGTAAQWAAINPTLSANETGTESDTGLSKVGNGSTAWNSLLYYTDRDDGAIGPSEMGYNGWAFDPEDIFQGGGANGTLLMIAIKPIRPTITNLHMVLYGAGGSLTAGANWAGLYSKTGVRLGLTTDRTTQFGGATGLLTMPLTSPVTVVPGEIYYLGYLSNGSGAVPTFCVSVGSSFGAVPIIPVNGGPYRHAYDASHAAITTLPTTAGPSFGVGSHFWGAFS